MERKPHPLPACPLARSRSPAARSPSRDNSPLPCWSGGTAVKAEVREVRAGACSTAVPLATQGGTWALVQPPFLQPPGQCIIVTGVFSCRSLLGHLSQLLGQSSPLLRLLSTRHQQDSSSSRAMVLASAHHTGGREPQWLSPASGAASFAPHPAPRRGRGHRVTTSEGP